MGKPFENTGKKIPFEELVKLIDKKCEYKFAVISDEIDDELMEKARNGRNKSLAFHTLYKRPIKKASQ